MKSLIGEAALARGDAEKSYTWKRASLQLAGNVGDLQGQLFALASMVRLQADLARGGASPSRLHADLDELVERLEDARRCGFDWPRNSYLGGRVREALDAALASGQEGCAAAVSRARVSMGAQGP
jgi:hypothetical protein